MKTKPKTIDHKGYVIPTGKRPKNRKEREKIITHFYKNWLNGSTEKSVKNLSLNKLIHVNRDSFLETRYWGSRSYQSTLTVLELSYVLKNAVVTGKNNPKPGNKNQSKFTKMLIMECVVPKLRPHVTTGKLTVGIRKSDNQRLQYCLTAK